MKKTIYFIARALLCFFFRQNIGLTPYERSPFLVGSNHAFTQLSEPSNPIESLALLAKKELILEMLNRKRSILTLIFCFFLSFSALAQVQNHIKLSVGDKVNDVSFLKILNYKDTALKFSQLRGKAIIMDFWATYCTACLKHFPKMDSLQKQFNKNLQIFLVNAYVNDTGAILMDFLNKENAKISGFRLPIVQSTEELRAIFPIKSMPHYIWIGSDGRIKAITGPEQITVPNIKLLIAGLTLNIKNKIE